MIKYIITFILGFYIGAFTFAIARAGKDKG